MTEDFINEMGLKLTTLIAGLVGGLVSLSYKKKMPWYKAILVIVVGGITAGYTTPLFSEVLSLGPNLENSLAFVLGLMGMRLTTAVISFIEKVAADPIGFFQKLRGK